MELYILFLVCLLLVVLGIPYALAHKSPLGWAVGGIGAAGVTFLIIQSIVSASGNRPTYERFLVGMFFFFTVLGISAGLFIGIFSHSLPFGVLVGLGGLIAGYLLGILAGLWLQYLGWLSAVANGLAWLAVFGMFSADLVLLTGRLLGR